MRRNLLLFMGAIAVAAMLLAMGNRSMPTVSADPSTAGFDIVMDDPDYSGQNANCPATDAGDGNIDPSECPDVITNLTLDTNGPGTRLDEPYFDLANTVWRVTGSTSSDGVDQDGDGSNDSGYANIPTSGIRATPGDLINEGAVVGYINFSIHSNIGPIASNNIDDTDGQRWPARTETSKPPLLDSTFILLAAELSTAPAEQVSHTDADDNGTADSQEDVLLADCSTAGSNGIPDGADCMPEPIVTLLDALALPGGAFEGRSFGLAQIAAIMGTAVYVDVNFLVINLVSEGEGYLSYTLVQYTFVPAGNPAPLFTGTALGQGIATAPPFASEVYIYGVTQDNTSKYISVGPKAYTNDPNVDGDEIMRQVVSGSSGSFDYLIFLSTDEDYDGDGIAAHADLCDTDPALGQQGPDNAAGDDTDQDATVGDCDVNDEGTGIDDPSGTNPGPYSTCPDSAGGADGLCDDGFGGWVDGAGRGTGDDVWAEGQDFDEDDPTGDWNGDTCPGICNVDDDDDGKVDEDSAGAEPGDGGYLNDTDADDDEDCVGTPGTPSCGTSGGIDEAIHVGDGFLNAGDNCAALPNVDVDGDTTIDYQADSDADGVGDACDPAPNIAGDGSGYGSYHDHDRICIDPFTIGAAEPAGGGACNTVQDSNDDGIPDLADIDGDGVLDDGEWDPKNNDNPDWDGDTTMDADYTFTSTDYESDACEVYMGTDPLDPSDNSASGASDKYDCDGDTTADEDDSSPFDGLTAGDYDADGCTADKELGNSHSFGGQRDPANPWDFYDVPTPAIHIVGASAARDGGIAGADLGAVLFYSGCAENGPACASGADYDDDLNSNSIKDGREYDRRATQDPAQPWRCGPPDGGVAGADLGAVLASSGDAC